MNPLRLLVWHQCRLTSEVLAESLRAAPDVGSGIVVRDLKSMTVEASRLGQCIAVIAGDIGPHVLDAASALVEEVPRCGVVIVATEPAPIPHVATRANTNISLVSHNAGMAHLMHAIRGAATGCPTVDLAMTRAAGAENSSPLSDRERDVLILTAGGSPIKEIAMQLFLTPGTIRNVSSAAIRKVAARNRFEAARLASSRGWL